MFFSFCQISVVHTLNFQEHYILRTQISHLVNSICMSKIPTTLLVEPFHIYILQKKIGIHTIHTVGNVILLIDWGLTCEWVLFHHFMETVSTNGARHGVLVPVSAMPEEFRFFLLKWGKLFMESFNFLPPPLLPTAGGGEKFGWKIFFISPPPILLTHFWPLRLLGSLSATLPRQRTYFARINLVFTPSYHVVMNKKQSSTQRPYIQR